MSEKKRINKQFKIVLKTSLLCLDLFVVRLEKLKYQFLFILYVVNNIKLINF